MIQTSNYEKQSRTLPVQNSFQLTFLQLTDGATLLREACKVGTLVGSILIATNYLFDSNPANAITITAVSGVSWLALKAGTSKMELQAEEMIRDFQRSKSGIDNIDNQEARRLGLVE